MDMSIAQLFAAISTFPPPYLLLFLLLSLCVTGAFFVWIYMELALARHAWLRHRARARSRAEWIANSTRAGVKGSSDESQGRTRRRRGGMAGTAGANTGGESGRGRAGAPGATGRAAITSASSADREGLPMHPRRGARRGSD